MSIGEIFVIEVEGDIKKNADHFGLFPLFYFTINPKLFVDECSTYVVYVNARWCSYVITVLSIMESSSS